MSAVKIKLFKIFFKYISGLLSGFMAVYEAFDLLCSALFFWLASLFSFTKKASVCLLYIDLQLSSDKDRGKKKHVFLYQERHGLEKQWHTDQFVAQKSAIAFLFIVKQAENREIFRVLCSIQRDHNPNQTMPHILDKAVWFLKCYH